MRSLTFSVEMIRNSPPGSSSTSTEEPGAYPRASNSLGIEITLLLPTRRTLTTFMRAVYTRIAQIRLRGYQLAVFGKQADIQAFATEIQSSMQHCDRAPRGWFSVTNGACHRGGPPSSHSNASVSFGH